MTFVAKEGSRPLIGATTIPEDLQDKEYCATICWMVEPNKMLERGNGYYYCDTHVTREQLVILAESIQDFLNWSKSCE